MAKICGRKLKYPKNGRKNQIFPLPPHISMLEYNSIQMKTTLDREGAGEGEMKLLSQEKLINLALATIFLPPLSEF